MTKVIGIMKFKSKCIVVSVGLISACAANAGGGAGTTLFGGDVSYNALLRLEVAFSTSGEVSAANQYGLGSNGVPINRAAGNPATFYRTPLLDTNELNGLLGSLGVTLPDTSLSGTPPRGVTNSTGVADTVTRYIDKKDQRVNYHMLRFEATPSISWGAWSIQTRIRALYDPGALGYQDFNYKDYADINGGFETGRILRQYHSGPDYLGYEVDGRKHPLLFERSGKNYMVDLPAFFVEWTNGNVTARLGNQSVAWGQLLFFRVMDTANGLDLRRHFFLDRAVEEYADERESAPGLRLTWQASDELLLDSFVQQFIPTILPNSNTSYNVVDSRFILHDNYDLGDYNSKVNYGIRLKGEFGNFNLQAMATSRLNPLGSIRWTKSNVNKPLPNSNVLGLAFNTYCQTVLGSPLGQGCGPQLAETPFEVAPLGLLSAEEWFDRAGYTKLDAVDGLNAIVTDFAPATTQLLTSTVTTADAANNELNAFFMASEGVHGHIERDYYREQVYGIGGGYVVDADPGSLLDQLLINVEATYTPHRTFSAITLGKNYDKREEYQVGMVLEKYQRFSTEFPATYMVFQYLWQKQSSLEGLLLDGYGSENFSSQGVKLTDGVPTNTHPKLTPGIKGGANYLVLSAVQPTEAYVFEYSFASLIDVQGGILFQPGVQWKPRGDVTVNVFYNYLDANVWGGNKNKSFISLIDHADELAIRLGYQF